MSEVTERTPARARKPQAKLPPVTDMFLKCPRCRHAQHVYVYNLDDKPWIKCDHCDTLLASGAWSVIYLGNL